MLYCKEDVECHWLTLYSCALTVPCHGVKACDCDYRKNKVRACSVVHIFALKGGFAFEVVLISSKVCVGQPNVSMKRKQAICMYFILQRQVDESWHLSDHANAVRTRPPDSYNRCARPAQPCSSFDRTLACSNHLILTLAHSDYEGRLLAAVHDQELYFGVKLTN